MVVNHVIPEIHHVILEVHVSAFMYFQNCIADGQVIMEILRIKGEGNGTVKLMQQQWLCFGDGGGEGDSGGNGEGNVDGDINSNSNGNINDDSNGYDGYGNSDGGSNGKATAPS